MSDIRFILASQSPRRRDLMQMLGRPVEVVVSGADEETGVFNGPDDYVVAIARRKAEAIAATVAAAHHPPSSLLTILVAADTTVALDGHILGKPVDEADARRMLLALRGRVHEVHTGLCLINLSTGAEYVGLHTAHVQMRDYTPAEIDAYIATNDPMDKAGAYAIQHPDFRPVSGLSGCYMGVMGLSICHLIQSLPAVGATTSVDPQTLRAAHGGYPCPLIDLPAHADG